MKEITAEKLQFVTDTLVAFFIDLEILEHVEVPIDSGFGVPAGAGEIAIGKRVSNGKQEIGDAFHRGDDDGHAGLLNGGAHELRSVEHAIGSEKRTATELEGHGRAMTFGASVPPGR